MKSPRYKIYRNTKANWFFIKKRVKFLFFNWYIDVIELVPEIDGHIDRIVIKFDSVKQCKNYIRDVLEWEKHPAQFELIEEIE